MGVYWGVEKWGGVAGGEGGCKGGVPWGCTEGVAWRGVPRAVGPSPPVLSCPPLPISCHPSPSPILSTCRQDHGGGSRHRADRGGQRLPPAPPLLQVGAARRWRLEAAFGVGVWADSGGRPPGGRRGLLVSPPRRPFCHQGAARLAQAAPAGLAPGRTGAQRGAGLRFLSRTGHPWVPRVGLRHLAPTGDLAGTVVPAFGWGGAPTPKPRSRRRRCPRSLPPAYRGRRHRPPAAGRPPPAFRPLRRRVLTGLGDGTPRSCACVSPWDGTFGVPPTGGQGVRVPWGWDTGVSEGGGDGVHGG